jgi:FkbM family methyltransferase
MTSILTRHPSFRAPARIEIEAPIARALAAIHGKPRGLARVRHKILKAVFSTLHQKLGLAAPARLVLADGRSFAVDCANTAFIEYARVTVDLGCYEPDVTAILELLAPHLGTVYDIGANWGYFSLLLGTNPHFRGHVHAFEINPATSGDLARTIAGAGLHGRVTCHAQGLSDVDGTVWLRRGKHSVLSRVVPADEPGPADPVAVHRLDALDLPPPDLIKLDVEGHELAVLRGSVTTLRQAAPFIVFESWHPGDDPQTVIQPLEFLEAEGYTIHRLIAHPNRLEAVPIRAADRAAIPEALNLLAVPKGRTVPLS